MKLTSRQELGWPSCAPPPMRGTNQVRPGAMALVAQGWAVQVQEPGMDDAVDGGWLTMARANDERDSSRFRLVPLHAPDWCSLWCGAVLLDEEDALRVARKVLEGEAEKGLNRPVRIFHAYAGCSRAVARD